MTITNQHSSFNIQINLSLSSGGILISQKLGRQDRGLPYESSNVFSNWLSVTWTANKNLKQKKESFMVSKRALCVKFQRAPAIEWFYCIRSKVIQERTEYRRRKDVVWTKREFLSLSRLSEEISVRLDQLRIHLSKERTIVIDSYWFSRKFCSSNLLRLQESERGRERRRKHTTVD